MASAAAGADNPPAMPPAPIHPPPRAIQPPQQQRPAIYVQDMYRDPFRRRREPTFISRAVIVGLSVFLFFASLSVLIWFLLHPDFPQLHVISAAMSSVGTGATALSVDCNITFTLTNPNRHLTAVYDAMEFSLLYPSQRVMLSRDQQPPFAQLERSRSTIEANLRFNSHNLEGDVVLAVERDLNRGGLALAVQIMAVVRYRIWKWKTTAQFMRAYCGGVSFGFTSTQKPGTFLNPYQECQVYLYT